MSELLFLGCISFFMRSHSTSSVYVVCVYVFSLRLAKRGTDSDYIVMPIIVYGYILCGTCVYVQSNPYIAFSREYL